MLGSKNNIKRRLKSVKYEENSLGMPKPKGMGFSVRGVTGGVTGGHGTTPPLIRILAAKSQKLEALTMEMKKGWARACLAACGVFAAR